MEDIWENQNPEMDHRMDIWFPETDNLVKHRPPEMESCGGNQIYEKEKCLFEETNHATEHRKKTPNRQSRVLDKKLRATPDSSIGAEILEQHCGSSGAGLK